ncbi:MAG: helix-turn-helix transcriptional regulator, partial [Elusimicrobia bacterium]|nr:helix-turn-helix transcriptional regulator [Elusimicrobiota bacterium]
EIIDLLRSGEKAVSELAEEMGVSKANLSQQLAVMRDKGLLATRREGQWIYYRLAYPKMLKAYDLLRDVLMERMMQTESIAQQLRKLGHKP